MATQTEVDALTATATQVAADIATVQTELTAYVAANPTIDLAALQAAVAPLDDAVKALGALVPTSATTPPVETPPAEPTPEPAPAEETPPAS